MKQIKTWHIHIKGQVQGVGFRPFVYQLAQKFQLKGWVNNTTDGVHIEVNADEVDVKKFYDEVVINAPQLAHITSYSLEEIASVAYEDFQIIPSSNQDNPVLLISPDFAMCEECRKEISDQNNRRYNYAFTTCTQCGPRYSIIKQLPYDRENTTMDIFKMCSKCNEEYNDPTNHRHFSQTNSCPDCAVVMELYDNSRNCIELNQEKIIEQVCKLWKQGKIVAIKSIGGFLLTCDASNAAVIKELRIRKHRPSKPFALMYHQPEEIAHVNETERLELESVAAPIILLKLKEQASSLIATDEISPGLSHIGIMLPYNPMFQLLLTKFNKPIVATSGNISNAPIIYKNEEALNTLGIIADYILVHNRSIISPQDDSVIKFSSKFNQRIVLRRSRGLAPGYITEGSLPHHKTILALGAMMKSTFTLQLSRNVHVSQYLGSTDNYDAQNNYKYNLDNFLTLFHAKPGVVLTDKHPGYYTTHLGESIAEQNNVPVIKIQHHHAHFASVLGEHNLFNETEPVLGVIWDGTGYGDDKQIWGGEFFVYDKNTVTRLTHFEYFNHLLGDKMAKEPRLSAFSLCNEIDEAENFLQSKFSKEEWFNYKKLIKSDSFKTSSVGRVFDAVASLLGLIDKSSYEGEAALLLEEAALQFFDGTLEVPKLWLTYSKDYNFLNLPLMVKEVICLLKSERPVDEIAAWFHVRLVLAIRDVAETSGIKKVCFSGGVFQNGLLVDLLVELLGEKNHLYFNKELPPNDENISFGQVMSFLNMKYEIGNMLCEI
ncbi:MAG: carbamoyltransferase HypF [Chitinophagaceae bacterium]